MLKKEGTLCLETSRNEVNFFFSQDHVEERERRSSWLPTQIIRRVAVCGEHQYFFDPA